MEHPILPNQPPENPSSMESVKQKALLQLMKELEKGELDPIFYPEERVYEMFGAKQ